MNRIILRRLVFASFICLAGQQVQAQGFSSAALEQLKLGRMWFHSRNAAGTAFDDLRNYSDTQLGYLYEDGNLHRSQEGGRNNTAQVKSEGFLNLKDAYVWGKFTFEQRNIHDAGYNASITDPYRGMPYYVADTHHSNWRNQYYDLDFRVATPLYWNKVAFGLSGTYKASIAAKQRDPRVDTRFYTLEVSPAVTYQVSPRHKIGLSLEYASIKEDSRMSNVNVYDDQDYYELYGLGVASKGLGSGRTTDYHGNRVGGGLQYGYDAHRLRLLVEGTYTTKVENVDISYTTPRKDASVKDQCGGLSAALFAVSPNGVFGHHARLGYSYRHIDGIQYVSQRDNTESQSGWMELYHSVRSTYKNQSVTGNYAFWRNKGVEYDWKVEAKVAYEHEEDKYLLPSSSKSWENIYADVSVKYNAFLCPDLNRRLLVGGHLGYNTNLSGSYNYGGTHADYPTVTEMETLDEQFLTSNYCTVGFEATYSQQYDANRRGNLFAKVKFDYAKASVNSPFNYRRLVSVGVGLNF